MYSTQLLVKVGLMSVSTRPGGCQRLEGELFMVPIAVILTFIVQGKFVDVMVFVALITAASVMADKCVRGHRSFVKPSHKDIKVQREEM